MRANGAERLDYGFYLEKYHCGICDDTQAGAGAGVRLKRDHIHPLGKFNERMGQIIPPSPQSSFFLFL
jgi:hypothetical protein